MTRRRQRVQVDRRRVAPAGDPVRAALAAAPAGRTTARRSGCVADQSSSCSRKSSSPASAHCMSSKTRTTGCSRGQLLEEQAPAGEQLLARKSVSSVPISTPSRGAQELPRRRVRDPLGQARRRASGAHVSVGSSSAMPSRVSDHLRPAPSTRRPRRRSGSAPSATARRRRGRRRTCRTPSAAATCPRLPDRSPSPGARARPRPMAWNSSLTRLSSRARPTKAASRPSMRCAPPLPATTRTARHSCSGSALPLTLCTPASA